jgi:hypothetical protein
MDAVPEPQAGKPDYLRDAKLRAPTQSLGLSPSVGDQAEWELRDTPALTHVS